VSLNSAAAEQLDTAHKGSRDVYASKLGRAHKSASTLTWLNILGNASLTFTEKLHREGIQYAL